MMATAEHATWLAQVACRLPPPCQSCHSPQPTMRRSGRAARIVQTLSLVVRDQFGCTEVLEDVHLNQPLLEVALRLESRLPHQSTPHQQQQSQQSPQGQMQPPSHALPELDLLSLQGETLPLLHNPAACGLADGDTILCYRYAEACRQFQQHQAEASVQSAAAHSGVQGSAAPPASKTQYVGLYLSDWLCGYQARMLLHHDLSVPFSVLLGAFCSMRGINADDASFMWLQFYRKVSRGQRQGHTQGLQGVGGARIADVLGCC